MNWLRLITAVISVAGAAYLWWELRMHRDNARKPIVVYAAVIASISALFRVSLMFINDYPEWVRLAFRSGDVTAVIVMLTLLALALAVRGMR